jgi:hypothetical protein
MRLLPRERCASCRENDARLPRKRRASCRENDAHPAAKTTRILPHSKNISKNPPAKAGGNSESLG